MNSFPGLPLNKGYSGAIAWARDDDTPTVYSSPAAQFTWTSTNNNEYPDLIDAAETPENVVAGVIMAPFAIQLMLRSDVASAGDWSNFLNDAFGPRGAMVFGVGTSVWTPGSGNQCPPYRMTMLPANGLTPISMNGVYFDTLDISAAFAVRGGGAAVRVTLTGYVLNPFNAADSGVGLVSSSDLTIPSALSIPGRQIASFARSSVTNGASSSTVVYDGPRSVRLQLSNGLDINPSMLSVVNRIASGCTPSRIKGMAAISQLKGANTVIPLSGVAPISLLLPTGDGSKTLTIALSLNYDSRGLPLAPRDFNTLAGGYSLYSGSSVNGTSSYPFVASYA